MSGIVLLKLNIFVKVEILISRGEGVNVLAEVRMPTPTDLASGL